nr:MAG TPA: hypothetical protein [Bacteriophage sp.]
MHLLINYTDLFQLAYLYPYLYLLFFCGIVLPTQKE